MIDIKRLIKEYIYLNKLLKKRNFNIDINFLIKKENFRKEIQSKLDNLRFNINDISKKIGFNKKNIDYIKYNINNLKFLKNKSNILKNNLNLVKKEIYDYCSIIPNIPDITVPIYNNYCKNNISYWGEKKTYDFIIKDYKYIGNHLNGLDFKSSSYISGSKFVIMKDKIALIHRALIQFMLDIHINKHKYIEVYVPLIVNYNSLYGTGQFPKFLNNVFSINNKSLKNYYLIPTSEVPLVNMLKNKIIYEYDLPIKYVSYTPCFRSESDSYGKNSGGLIKLNQFDKVEMIQFVHPNLSFEALEEITNHAEIILKLLNLHYRKRLLYANEMSFSSCKTYDLEVWFPYQNKYIEVSSCSNTSDFQSRRISAKFKNKNNDIKFIHILNGSGLAINRTLAAIIENYQTKDLNINIPSILIPYIKNYI